MVTEFEVRVTRSGLRYRIPIEGSSGDEKYIARTANSGEEYTPKGFEINPTDTIIDVGAHIGRFVIYAASLASKGIVYAFEPQPENLKRLKENITLNGLSNIELSQKAIADKKKKIQLHVSTDSARSSIYGDSKKTVEVDCIKLSEVFDINKITRCNFLKLDCEGAEFEILFALPMPYFKKIEKIVLEFHDHLSPDKKLRDLLPLLSSQEYLLSARWGAFYTGLLFGKKTSFRVPLLFVVNVFRVYIIDFARFLVRLILGKIFPNLKG